MGNDRASIGRPLGSLGRDRAEQGIQRGSIFPLLATLSVDRAELFRDRGSRFALLATLAVDRAELFRDRGSRFALLATNFADRAERFALRDAKFALLATKFAERAGQGAKRSSYFSAELLDLRHVLATCFHALVYDTMRLVEFRDTLFGDVPLSSWVREPRLDMPNVLGLASAPWCCLQQLHCSVVTLDSQ